MFCAVLHPRHPLKMPVSEDELDEGYSSHHPQGHSGSGTMSKAEQRRVSAIFLLTRFPLTTVYLWFVVYLSKIESAGTSYSKSKE